MKLRVEKWGRSLAVRIPAVCAKELGLRTGMELEATLVNGGLHLRRRKNEYTLEALLAQITPANIHGETDWGAVVERESW
jgi:antitoxin MazE